MVKILQNFIKSTQELALGQKGIQQNKNFPNEEALIHTQQNSSAKCSAEDDSTALAELEEAQNAYEAKSVEDLQSIYSNFDDKINTQRETALDLVQEYYYNDSNLAELESTKSDITADIAKNQSALQDIQNGSHELIAGAQNEVNKAQDEYSKALDESNNPEIVALRDSIEENTLNIAEQENMIAFCENEISTTQSDIQTQENTIASLESEINSYASQISSLQAKLNSTDNEKLAAKLQSQISSLQRLKGNAEARKTSEEAVKQSLEEKLDSLQQQKTQEEKKLEDLKQTRDDLEKQIEEVKDETINNALKNLQEARENLETTKQDLISQVKTAITNANQQLSEVEAQIAQVKQELFEKEQEAQLNQPIEQQSDAIQSSVYPQTSSAVNSPSASRGAIGNATSANTAQNASSAQIENNYKQASEELKNQTKNLNDIYNGTNVDLSPKKELQKSNFTALHSALQELNPSLASQIQTTKTQLDSKEAQLDAKDREIANYENEISDLKSQSNNILITISSLEEAKDSLDKVDTSKLDSKKKSELSEKKSALDSEIKNANSSKKEIAKAIKEKENSDEYKKLKQERTELKKEYDDLLKDLEDKMAQAVSEYPEIKEKSDSYSNSYKDYSTAKTELIDKTKGEITTSQSKVAELSKTNAMSEANALASKYKFSDNNGDAVINFAESFIGCNEADGSANKFLNGGSSSATPWCAAFVQYVMQNSGEYGDVASWYKNIDNKWYCPNIYNAANQAGAVIDQNQAQEGDIVLFYNNSKGRYAHVGIVKSIDADGTVHTIEGNTSNQVAERVYAPGSRNLTFCKAYA